MGEQKIELRQDPFILEKIIDVIPYYVFWKDLSCIFLGCNQTFAQWAGFDTPAEVVGKTDYDCSWKKEEAEFIRTIDRQVMATRIPILNLEESITTPNGQIRTLLASKVPLFDSKDEVCGVLGVVLDITDRKKMENLLEQQNAMMQAIFDSFPDSLVYSNKNREIIRVSRSFESLFKYSMSELIGQQNSVLYSDPSIKTGPSHDIFADPEASATDPFEMEYLRSDGSSFISETVVADVQSSTFEPLGYLEVIRDITKKKAMEEEMKKQQMVNQHNSKLVAIGQLAAGVGHEINNPLAIMLGYLQQLEREFGKLEVESPKATEIFKKIRDAGQRITNIVSGLRTFSRAHTNEMKVFSLSTTVIETAAMVKDIYHREGVELDVSAIDKTVWMNGNQGRIQQVLMNLLANAKDALEGRSDKIIVLSLENVEGTACLCVKDNGAGMPEEVREKVFDAFFTTKEVNRGTGIGLSLVDSIVKEHGGEITFESEIDNGTEFFVKLPALEEADSIEGFGNGTASRKTANDLPHFPYSVLVVEDEPALQDILEDILTEVGCTVTSVLDGIEALKKMDEHSYDLIVTDIKMPNMDGPTLISEIHKKQLEKEPKLMVMTGGVTIDFDDQETKLAQQIDGFFLKPFERRKNPSGSEESL